MAYLDYEKYSSHAEKINRYVQFDSFVNEKVQQIIKKFCFDEELSEVFLKAQKGFFEEGCDDAKPIYDVREKFEANPFLVILAAYEMYSLKLLDKYRKNGWPEEVFWDSHLDLKIWCDCAYAKNGIYGLQNMGWLAPQIRGDLYRIGRLQFHQIPFPICDKYIHPALTVNRNDTVINIHIPEGEPFVREKRLDAYRKAYKFFGCKGPAAFVCFSWLLYTPHYDFLSDKSNIVDFMNDFDILVYHNSRAEFGDMWRVFGQREDYNLADLPRNTSLQRAYASRLENGGKLGSGDGIFIFDGEKILK